MSSAPDKQVCIYLDHIVLDQLHKGRQPRLKHFLVRPDVQVIYSDETLNEIARSVGYEERFLRLLVELRAKYLRVSRRDDWTFDDRATLEDLDPRTALDNHVKTINDTPRAADWLADLLQKFFGGHGDRRFEDIAQDGYRELNELLEIIRREAPPEIANALGDTELLEGLRAQFQQMGQLLDSGTVGVRDLDTALGVGPAVLNNITGPNVLKQIWSLIERRLPAGTNVSLETFFGIERLPSDTNAKPLTALERINGIYHQLNFVGYYRDKDIRKASRLRASLSDMTHADLASFSHVFVTMDQALFRKAEAAYEYLGIGTKLIYVSAPTPSSKL